MRKNCCGYPVVTALDAFGESDALADILRKVSGLESPRIHIVADLNVVQRTDGLGPRIGRYVQEHGIPVKPGLYELLSALREKDSSGW